MGRRLAITQVAPLWERVPPPKYGGSQRIIASLTEELVRRGHAVTLFATGDSHTSAKLRSVFPKALYRAGIPWTSHTWPTLNIVSAFEEPTNLIHVHIDRTTEYAALVLAAATRIPTLFTLHFTLFPGKEHNDRRAFLSHFRYQNFVSISDSQRRAFPKLNWVATVRNGIEVEHIAFSSKRGKYLLWLGRISRAKGTREAIEIARKARRPLILAGKLDKLNAEDLAYFEAEVKPLIDGRGIRYIGEVGEEKRNRLLASARVLLNPIQWEEPFGLVPVEAMAAGTPVIATRRGAMPELIKDGETGFLVDSVEEAVEALGKVDQLDRGACRAHVERAFSIQRMVDEYEKVYDKVLA